tara:strand:- start:2121 stop:2690 length:570 start_codon:yes stop_codon:yes gene_type:complete
MKRIIFISIILITNLALGQFNTAFKPAKVFLKSGDTINGIVKVGTKIKFKTHQDSKKITKYTPDDIYGFDLLVKRKIIKYRYRYLKEKDKSILLSHVIHGKVNLFIDEIRLNDAYNRRIDLSYKFYVGRDNDSLATYMSTNLGSFKGRKPVMEYFKDCTSLYAKIESGLFKISEMDEIVEYYNENCNSE